MEQQRNEGTAMKKMSAVALVGLCSLGGLSGLAELIVTNAQVDGNGVLWYSAWSGYNGPDSTVLRVVSPEVFQPGVPHRFIYVLPVIAGVDLDNKFGDGLEEFRRLNIHNVYNAHLIAPSFHGEPWYADSDQNAEQRYESFMTEDLVPWVRGSLGVTGEEEHWLVGFSKSAFGALTLLFRNPDVFTAAAAWDFPADQPDAYGWMMIDNYGSDANFQVNYRLTSDWLQALKEPFQGRTRLWLSSDYVSFDGFATYRDQVLSLANRLSGNGIAFQMDGGANRLHVWGSGWIPEAVGALNGGLSSENLWSSADDFNWDSNELGVHWEIDPFWGAGLVVRAGEARALGSGGAYSMGNDFGPDHYSEIQISEWDQERGRG